MRTAEQEEIAREDGASVLKDENGGLVLSSSIRVRCPLMGVSDTPSRAFRPSSRRLRVEGARGSIGREMGGVDSGTAGGDARDRRGGGDGRRGGG